MTEVERVRSPGADKALGWKYRVLDHGYVALMDYMGADESVTRAARTSYGKGTKTLRDDESLLRYMLRHKHSGPFEFCEATFLVYVPLYVWAQLKRHRTFSINERSHRYSEAEEVFQFFEGGEFRLQSTRNKQGSEGHLPVGQGSQLTKSAKRAVRRSVEVYREQLAQGVSREQARTVLPQNLYTRVYWKGDLRNILHCLHLRLDPHAQAEARAYADAMAQIVKEWVPMTWRAFQDYTLDAMTLTGPEVRAVQLMIQSIPDDVLEGLVFDAGEEMSDREISELRAKLDTLGLV